MLSPIAFDDEAMFETNKIDDEIAERKLTPPFHFGEPAIPQETPERFLGLGWFVTHISRTRLGEERNGSMERRHLINLPWVRDEGAYAPTPHP